MKVILLLYIYVGGLALLLYHWSPCLNGWLRASTTLRAQLQQPADFLTHGLQEDDVDPLDAFMDAAVNPEVAAAEKAEAARKEELRTQQVKALAVSATFRLQDSKSSASSSSHAGHLTRQQQLRVCNSQSIANWHTSSKGVSLKTACTVADRALHKE